MEQQWQEQWEGDSSADGGKQQPGTQPVEGDPTSVCWLMVTFTVPPLSHEKKKNTGF